MQRLLILERVYPTQQQFTKAILQDLIPTCTVCECECECESHVHYLYACFIIILIRSHMYTFVKTSSKHNT